MTKKTFLLFLTFVFIFFLSLQVITDTDFGWHLRVGEYIINTQTIPKKDLFSFSQSNYPYVYHSWAGEILVFASYKLLGLYGVSILFSLILTICLFFIYKITQILSDNKVSYPLLILAVLLASTIAGGRMRVFGLLYLSITYFLFLKFQKQNSKIIWAMPLVFFLWVNFHGSFILGIVTLLALIVASQVFAQDKKRQFKKTRTLLSVSTLSILATLINPYFLSAWLQAITMTSNSYLYLSSINLDWQPLITPGGTGWILAVIVFAIIFFLFFFKTKIGSLQKFFLLLFSLLSLITSRFTIALFVFLVPIANQLYLEFKGKLASQILNSISVRFAVFALFTVLFLTAAKNLLEINQAYLSPENYSRFLATKSTIKFYGPWPYRANLYLEKNLPEKRILNDANWGNFMIFQNQNRKVFYWGAMDNFIINGRSFVLEYLNLIQAAPDWEEKIERYQIDAVFLPPSFPLIAVLKLKPDWQIVYQDNQAIIFVKNPPTYHP
ncbi:hypothetical protein A3H87_00360 [Candidatus Curtissbacteria bacterium RIFCSPLOWO2_02_FULL_42_37]|uniref:Glycosyltransferase RgtA/B/C/D-like domain-containing protein n=1 Tax=Candidatus Curtissbacteria bacterium RIFCSPLOWO2_01_FULL_42_50 TaxID=1797730 RepID=A0A1F5H594_9BACT|nr:MAG: hypothetical protein A3C33_04010 [Candidatus Curtissbacteria bacterium RIFCSPHIGHO2_02_FULL_42_58]OGD97606.1 MAG: hypothetical protein A3E71_05295 [Candidatus Curtissbacteria bacterium RIFCSPHIGHO2_12_FULL_42_33]OGD99300.1 MAG: hypothetical protein A3B54_02865 [Candidatus Curtissbacteria bacterium RIFCSPLOWO2_01_FULL_42_50]OGE02578.1 MAG: hypothetical protein A3G16_03550 [Candidatus Curtissbacteria bacterium RIFCSPLOWO2_12_FULL_41_16]OGE09636.1 MAG: hypothetical protein A3H87_00360 [Can